MEMIIQVSRVAIVLQINTSKEKNNEENYEATSDALVQGIYSLIVLTDNFGMMVLFSRPRRDQ